MGDDNGKRRLSRTSADVRVMKKCLEKVRARRLVT